MSKDLAEELHFQTLTRTSDPWKTVSSIIMTVVDEAYFEAGSDGLTFRSMDPSHIALVDLNWPGSDFDEYKCPSTIKFGFRITEFAKLAKRMNPNDSMEVAIKDNSLCIRSTGSYARSYKMNLIESSGSNTSPLPQLSFDSKMDISISAFDKILSDIQVISDNITMETVAGTDGAKFSGRRDNADAMVKVGNNDFDNKSRNNNNNIIGNPIIDLRVNENSKSSYNIDYISKVVKAISSISDGYMTLEFSSKKPLRLGFVIQGTLKAQFFLAPRADN
jgi:proliferating cell nuclear antigen